MGFIVRLRPYLFILIAVSYVLCGQAQTRNHQDLGFDSLAVSIPLSIQDTVYKLPRLLIVERSERVWLDSLVLLNTPIDYRCDYNHGSIWIPSKCLERIFSDSMPHRLFVTFVPSPFTFQTEYSLRQMTVRGDSSGRKVFAVTQSSPGFRSDDFFQKGFQ